MIDPEITELWPSPSSSESTVSDETNFVEFNLLNKLNGTIYFSLNFANSTSTDIEPSSTLSSRSLRNSSSTFGTISTSTDIEIYYFYKVSEIFFQMERKWQMILFPTNGWFMRIVLTPFFPQIPVVKKRFNLDKNIPLPLFVKKITSFFSHSFDSFHMWFTSDF